MAETPPNRGTPEEGQERTKAFHYALGRFVAMFARVEFATHIVLRHYAKISVPAARALLSGIKADKTRDVIRRLFEIGHLNQTTWNDLAPILDRFGEINNRRNFLLHHTTVGVAEGIGFVTNAGTAHIEPNVAGFDISAEILDDMTADLRKILVHLNARHMGKPLDDPKIDAILRVPWRYTLKSSRLAAPPKAAHPDQPKTPTRPARSLPPRE